MKQSDLDRAVAHATGEAVATIKRLGFLLADPTDSATDETDEHDPYIIDWDALAANRNEKNAWRPDYVPATV
ncbi:MAG TPA: hypothetical protein QF564_18880 [Pirellulaceae bacterium]|nr:hypothetical protein [Pirellulaceae bacterium]